MCLCLWEQVFLVPLTCLHVCVCLLPGSGCELSMNEWESHKHLRKQKHTDTLSGLYLWSWLRQGRGSRHAQLGSAFWLWRGSNQNTGAVKAPLDESQGAVERAECRPGFRGSGVRPVVNELTPLGLSGSEPPTLPHQPHQHRHNDIFLPQRLVPDHWSTPHFLKNAHITLLPWDNSDKMCVSRCTRKRWKKLPKCSVQCCAVKVYVHACAGQRVCGF